MRDSEIEQWVINEIGLMTGNRLKEVCVFSLNGVVSLKGTVRCRADGRAVQEAAALAKGVVEVINQLNLRGRNVARRRTSIKSQVGSSSSALHHLSPKTAGSSHVAN